MFGLPQVRIWSGKKIIQGQGKFRDLTRLIRTDLIILKAGRSIWVTVISTIFLGNEEGKFVENLNEWKGRL